VTNIGTLNIPKLDGVEVNPGIFCIGQPTPVPGTNLLRGLANVGGALCIVEFKLSFVGGPLAEERDRGDE
jgi:hypothetical protein